MLNARSDVEPVLGRGFHASSPEKGLALRRVFAFPKAGSEALSGRTSMVNQRHCPFCGMAAKLNCRHLALAVPGRDFVQCCIDQARADRQWKGLCAQVREHHRRTGTSSIDREDFTWLETAFCERFLSNLRWFGGMQHEWRTGDRLENGSFYVVLWSKSPERLWWELLDNIDRQLGAMTLLPLTIPSEPELFGKLQQPWNQFPA